MAAVINMSYMFYGAAAFNQSLFVWDVAAVTNMKNMFSKGNSFNQDISEDNCCA